MAHSDATVRLWQALGAGDHAAARDQIDAQLGEWLRGTETRPGATGEDDPTVAAVLRMAGEALAESAS